MDMGRGKKREMEKIRKSLTVAKDPSEGALSCEIVLYAEITNMVVEVLSTWTAMERRL